jgi:transcription antitermination factor NusG
MSNSWYALRSKPQKEDIVYRQLLSNGIETYYPTLRVKPINPRSKKIKPYFPGYMFIRADIDELGITTFQWMPHTIGLVSFGNEPAIVPENLIVEIKKRVEEVSRIGEMKNKGYIRGEIVEIHNGPFTGYEAIFDTDLSGSERVRVLLKLLNDKRQIILELNQSQVARKSN